MISNTRLLGSTFKPIHFALDQIQQNRVPRRLAGDVDGHRAPASGDGDGLHDHPAIDLVDQATSLGGGKEVQRSHQHAVAVAQTQQQLVLDDLASGEINDRLGVQEEAIMVEAVADPSDPGLAVGLAHRGRDAHLEPLGLVATERFGVVHGSVGVLEQAIGAGLVTG